MDYYVFVSWILVLPGLTAGIPLRHDMGNMSMNINTSSSVAQSYFNQGLRFTSTFKFDYAVKSHKAALLEDPDCAMCEWGLALAYGQNLNDALVMDLEPWFLDNEPLAYQAIQRARALLFNNTGGEGVGGGESGSDDDVDGRVGRNIDIGAPIGTSSGDEKEERRRPHLSARMLRERDEALVSALALKFVATVEQYESHFVDGLPASLNMAYAEAMAGAAVRSHDEGWPDHPIVLLLAADAWMNLSPWDYWESPHGMRPNAHNARLLLEDAMARDPDNPWAIHLFTHLMEAGAEAGVAVAPAQKLKYLVPGAPHLQHMPSHVEFRTGDWHNASEANLRAVELPDSDATYPDHNMDMLMWALGVEGRRAESKKIGARLSEFSTPRVEDGIVSPLLPPERYLAQEALHLCAFADWEGVLALDAPPRQAEFDLAVYHFARSLAFIAAKDWDSYRQEQGLITVGVEKMEKRTAYYGVYNAPLLTKILDKLSRAEGLRGGITASSYGEGGAPSRAANNGDHDDGGPVRRRRFLLLHKDGSPRWGAGFDGDVEGLRHVDGQGVESEVDRNRATTDSTAKASPSKAAREKAVTAFATTTTATTPSGSAGARQDELDLLREAVQMEDALGYDEPPPLPVPTRLFLAAALLRGDVDAGEDSGASVLGGSGSSGGGGGGGVDTTGVDGGVISALSPKMSAATAVVKRGDAEEAETVLKQLDAMYPKMGRTLLGLWKVSSALGGARETLEFREQFVDSWQYSEVWLEDIAHVGGVGVMRQQGGRGGGNEARAKDFDPGDGDGDGDGGGGGGGDGGKDGDTGISSLSVETFNNPASEYVGEGEPWEEEGGERLGRGGTVTTTATMVLLCAAALLAVSLAAVGIVATRRPNRACQRAWGCCFRKRPWEQRLVGEGGVAGTSDATWAHREWGSALKRNQYEVIE